MSSTLINFVEPAKKHSKLNLPNPQISDRDMQEVIKLRRASESTKESKSMKRDGKQASRSLREKFSSLPHPRNDYEIILPDENID